MSIICKICGKKVSEKNWIKNHIDLMSHIPKCLRCGLHKAYDESGLCNSCIKIGGPDEEIP